MQLCIGHLEGLEVLEADKVVTQPLRLHDDQDEVSCRRMRLSVRAAAPLVPETLCAISTRDPINRVRC